jgi:hypothetical protein
LKVQRTDAVVALRLICLQCKAENVDHLDGLLLACVSSSGLAPAVVVNSGATAWVRRLVEVGAGRRCAIIYR